MCRISYFILYVHIFFLLHKIGGAEDRLKWAIRSYLKFCLLWFEICLNCPHKMCMLEGKRMMLYSYLLFWSQGNRAQSYSLYHNYIFLICHLAQHTWFLAQQQVLFLCCFIIQVQSHRWQFLSPSIVQLWLESHSQVIVIIFQNVKCNHKLYGSNWSIGNNCHV